eukprot:6046984-Pyramimonas_sp.AAC.1
MFLKGRTRAHVAPLSDAYCPLVHGPRRRASEAPVRPRPALLKPLRVHYFPAPCREHFSRVKLTFSLATLVGPFSFPCPRLASRFPLRDR